MRRTGAGASPTTEASPQTMVVDVPARNGAAFRAGWSSRHGRWVFREFAA